jgi:hypothetical protein
LRIKKIRANDLAGALSVLPLPVELLGAPFSSGKGGRGDKHDGRRKKKPHERIDVQKVENVQVPLKFAGSYWSGYG